MALLTSLIIAMLFSAGCIPVPNSVAPIAAPTRTPPPIPTDPSESETAEEESANLATPVSEEPAAEGVPIQITNDVPGPQAAEPITSPTPEPSPTPIPPPTNTSPPQPTATTRVEASENAVPCTALAETWTGGRAEPDGVEGYDVSACIYDTTEGLAELVKPARRDASEWDYARCNDGTPFDFQVQLAPDQPSDEWVIVLEGGGFCENNVVACADRAEKTDLISTTPRRDRSIVSMQSIGIFKRNPQGNPEFHDSNYVFAHYCSSDLWSGTATQPQIRAGGLGWYFSGRINVKAMMEVLTEIYGLDDNDPTTKVLFAGSSAGGMGTQVNADLIAGILPDAAQDGRLLILNDGGALVEFDNPNFRPGDTKISLEDNLRRAYNLWRSDLNPLCEEAVERVSRHASVCFSTGRVYPYITASSPDGYSLPFMVQYSALDVHNLGLLGLDDFDQDDYNVLYQWYVAARESLSDVEWLFSAGEPYHVILLTNDWSMKADNWTFRRLLSRFWNGGQPIRAVDIPSTN